MRLHQRFDVQADTFDERAGLSQAVARAVARAVIEHGARGPHDLVVELGAATGAVGVHLAASQACYLGVDLSRPMLKVFAMRDARQRDGAEHDSARDRPWLVQADCERAWPVRDRAAAIVFASRLVHLLDASHVSREAARVCRPGGCLLVGRVVRDPRSARERLRREKQRLLVERGLEPRRGAAGTRRLLDDCMRRGAQPLPSRVAAAWTSSATAERVLSDWAVLPGMGGASIGSTMQAAILEDLWAWARRELGDLRQPEPCGEQYVLEGVRFGHPEPPTTDGAKSGFVHVRLLRVMSD